MLCSSPDNTEFRIPHTSFWPEIEDSGSGAVSIDMGGTITSGLLLGPAEGSVPSVTTVDAIISPRVCIWFIISAANADMSIVSDCFARGSLIFSPFRRLFWAGAFPDPGCGFLFGILKFITSQGEEHVPYNVL